MAEVKEKTHDNERTFYNTLVRLIASVDGRKDFGQAARRALNEIHRQGKEKVGEFMAYLEKRTGLNIAEKHWLIGAVREYFSKL